MADKKKLGRFTIQFNLKDPQQQRAAILLDRQGRYKAHFIASAVLHYDQCAGETVGNGVDAGKIKEILLELLRSDPDVLAVRMDTSSVPVEEERPLSWEGTVQSGDDRTVAAISNTLAAFQRQ